MALKPEEDNRLDFETLWCEKQKRMGDAHNLSHTCYVMHPMLYACNQSHPLTKGHSRITKRTLKTTTFFRAKATSTESLKYKGVQAPIHQSVMYKGCTIVLHRLTYWTEPCTSFKTFMHFLIFLSAFFGECD